MRLQKIRVLRSLTVHGSAPEVTERINAFLEENEGKDPKIISHIVADSNGGIIGSIVIKVNKYIDTQKS